MSWFSRIQNLHFSQTNNLYSNVDGGLVEFKIYTSLKLPYDGYYARLRLVEFKIYTSLKLLEIWALHQGCLVEFKIYTSLKLIPRHS